jgi:hypothetical protein
LNDFIATKQNKTMKKIFSVLLLTFFLAQTSIAQDFQWAKQLGGSTGAVTTTDVFVDVSGFVYTTGYFTGTVDLNPSPTASANFVSAGNTDIFILKIDPSGNYVRAYSFGSTGSDQGYSIAVDLSRNIYFTGSFSGTVDFNPSNLVSNLTAIGSSDAFVCKLTSGTSTILSFAYAKQFGGTGSENGCAISLDANGNVYSAGYFSGTVDFDPGANAANLVSSGLNDMYVSKLDALGNYIWAQKIGGTNDDIARAMVVDATGAVYFTGSYSGTVDFDPGVGTENLISASSTSDIFVCKLDATGSYIWAKGFGSSATSNPSTFDNSLPIATERGCGISLDAGGNVYTTGYFQETIDFDPGSATFNLTSAGNTDAFYSKLSPAGLFLWAGSVGGTASDAGYSITLDNDNIVFTAGFFNGIADLDPGSGSLSLTSAGGDDIFVSQLTTNGALVWAHQIGGTTNEICNKVVAKNNGNLLLSGTFSGSVDFNPSATTNSLSVLGTQDAFVVKWYYAPCQNNCLVPIINSISPISGPIGSLVTITGSNFNPIAANNVVYFGSVKATVTAASTTSLSVTVPVGANYEPLTVTNISNGRSVQSIQSFNVTFSPNKGSSVKISDFNNVVEINSSNAESRFLRMADFDGDGKPDIANAASSRYINNGGDPDNDPDNKKIHILRNVSTPGSIVSGSFSSMLTLTTLYPIDELVLGDVDGDGKTDIVVLFDGEDSGSEVMNIYRNTSVLGTISFVQTTLPCEEEVNSSFSLLADFNGDGKPDLAQLYVINGNSGKIAIYENTSSVGVCSFNLPININAIIVCGSCPSFQMDAGDIDGDGRIDLIYSGESNNISKIVKNIHQSGPLSASSFSVLASVGTTLPGSRSGILLSDLDGDGMLELIAAPDGSNSTLRINRNTSIPGTISFSPMFSISTSIGASGSNSAKSSIHAGDLTGDGKIDLVFITSSSSTQRIVTNKLLPGQTLSSNSFQVNNLNLGIGLTSPIFIDIDGDGKLDVIGRKLSYEDDEIDIYARRYDPKGDVFTGIVPTQMCPGTQINVPFTVNYPFNAGNVFTAQLSSETGSFSIPVNIGTLTSTALNGIISCVIPANTVPGTAYRIRVIASNPVITGSNNGSNIIINTAVSPFVSITASQTSICSTGSVTFTATNTNGGSSPTYQWVKNGINVGANTSVYVNSNALPGDVVYCIMTINSACTLSSVQSNQIVLSTVNVVVPNVSISASVTTICLSTTEIVYSAISTNSGVSPTYQWYKNGVMVFSGGNTYTDLSPSTGDQVYTIMTSNASCLSSATVQSSTISIGFTSTSVTPTVSISSSQTTICPSTSQVVFTAEINNGGNLPNYQWVKNGVNIGSNSPYFIDNIPAAGDVVYCVLTSNASCVNPANVTSNQITLSFSATSVIPSVTISSSPVLSCVTPSVVFTATPVNSGTNPHYVWKKNGSIVGGNAPVFQDVSVSLSDTITVDLLSNTNCSNNTTIVIGSLSFSNIITWTGAIDSDWHKACNWNPQLVPQQCHSVMIPFTANQPVVSQVAACKYLSIFSTDGAQLTLNNGANLQIETCPVAATEVSCP